MIPAGTRAIVLYTQYGRSCSQEESLRRTQSIGHQDGLQGGKLLTTESPDVVRLAQIKMSHQEKLTVLKGLDAEVLALVESEGAVMEEIEQSDVFKQDVYAVLVKIEQILL